MRLVEDQIVALNLSLVFSKKKLLSYLVCVEYINNFFELCQVPFLFINKSIQYRQYFCFYNYSGYQWYQHHSADNISWKAMKDDNGRKEDH